ncbi:hypothetical protein [Fictibacillus barbaricus]|jgi:hypothetical protein|uniref:Uncharacterized protein n=1 Tax=Fictibacillus barbaricus TaxID=182136 RepID=A0ABU1TXH0_9BACL|nr:hypothetical protein [Fictibacillus barbaricus]MDR7071878.1 hypothetical protein [Fictibacillus barbaricus]
METFIKSEHESYNAAKVNELLQRIKAYHDHSKVAGRVSEAMKICGYNQKEIDQVLKQMRGAG